MANLPTRNNNPGNIRGTDGQFIHFSTPLEGQIALYNDLTGKMTGNTRTGLKPDSTLFDLIKTWAPAADHNNPVAYVADVANKVGASPDTKLSDLMPKIDLLAKAIADHEGYQGQWQTGSKKSTISDFGSTPYNPHPFSQPAPGGPDFSKTPLSPTQNLANTVPTGNDSLNVASNLLANKGQGAKQMVGEGVKGLIKLPFEPALKGAASGVRAIEAIPQLARGTGGLLTDIADTAIHNPGMLAKAILHPTKVSSPRAAAGFSKAEAIMKKSLGGQETLSGASHETPFKPGSSTTQKILHALSDEAGNLKTASTAAIEAALVANPEAVGNVLKGGYKAAKAPLGVLPKTIRTLAEGGVGAYALKKVYDLFKKK